MTFVQVSNQKVLKAKFWSWMKLPKDAFSRKNVKGHDWIEKKWNLKSSEGSIWCSGASTAALIKLSAPNMQGHQKRFRGQVKIIFLPPQITALSHYHSSPEWVASTIRAFCCYLFVLFKRIGNKAESVVRKMAAGRMCCQHDKSFPNLILLRKPEKYTTELGPGSR